MWASHGCNCRGYRLTIYSLSLINGRVVAAVLRRLTVNKTAVLQRKEGAIRALLAY